MSDAEYPTLCDPIVSRPLVPFDAEAVFELTYAAELADSGQADIELDDILTDLGQRGRRSTSAAQSIGYFDGAVMVATGEVHRRRAEASVHPRYRGRGVGTDLFRWTVAKARELGYERVGQTVPLTNAPALALFARFGCETARGRPGSWSSRRVRSSLSTSCRPVIACGASSVTGTPTTSTEPSRTLSASGRTASRPRTLGDWEAIAFGRSEFEPWQIITVVEENHGLGRIVGACRVSVSDGEGWVDQIAVRHDARGRGLGRALLVAAFAQARSRGATTSRLNTDSRTGALGLYEHVGMIVVETYGHYAVDLH